MRVLVTGGAGYIGSHTVRLLRDRGYEVRVFDNLTHGHRAAVPKGSLIEGDLADQGHLSRVLAEERIEGILHFAAFTYVGESVRDPGKYYRNNLAATIGLLECARLGGISRFVFSSSCATYGVPDRMPITEEAAQQPINPYGYSKLAVERVLHDFAAAYNFGYVALRYFNAAGASPDSQLGEDHDPETHLIPLVLQAAMGQIPHVEIFGTDYPTPDGTCVRDYIHVCDLAEAHVAALEQVKPGSSMCYNLGIGRGYSVREVIQTARELTGKKIPVTEKPRRPGDPPVLIASSEKIARELGWKPRFVDLTSILATAWDWHRLNPQGYRD